MSKHFNLYMRSVYFLAFTITTYGILSGMYIHEITTFKYVLVTVFSLLCVLQTLESTNTRFESMLSMMYIFAITQFHLIPVILITILSNLLNAVIRKFKTKDVVKLFNVKSIFNLMSDVIGVSVSMLLYHFLLISFGQLLAVIGASISIAVVNIVLFRIVVLLYSGIRVLLTAREIVLSMVNNIGTSVIILFAYEAYAMEGLVFACLFLISFSTHLMLNTVKESLEKEVYTDGLTDVYNRGYLDKIIYDRLIQKDKFTLLFLDLDKFKEINDVYGHSIGDAVLKHFAMSLKDIAQKNEKVFRYGGDEFCLLIDHSDAVEKIVGRLNTLIELAEYSTTEYVIRYSFSMGQFNFKGEPDICPADVYMNASKTMFSSKSKICIISSEELC